MKTSPAGYWSNIKLKPWRNGIKGYHWEPEKSRFCVRIEVNGKKRRFGRYKTESQARARYLEVESKLKEGVSVEDIQYAFFSPMINAKDEIANLIIDSHSIPAERKLELIKYQNDHHEGIENRLKEAGQKFMELQKDRSHLSAVLAQLIFDNESYTKIISPEAIDFVMKKCEKGESPLFDYAENDDKSATLNLSWKGSDTKSDEVSGGDNVGKSGNNDKS